MINKRYLILKQWGDNMINSLFVNGCILIAFVYLSSQFFGTHEIDSRSPLWKRVLAGVLFGITGSSLMINGISFPTGIIVDLRTIPILLSAIYCGPVSAVVTLAMLIVFRVGIMGTSSVLPLAMTNMIFLCVVFSIISLLDWGFRKKYKVMSAINLPCSSAVVLIIFKDEEILETILPMFILSTMFLSIILYFILLYIHKTNRMYSKFREESQRDFLTGLYNVRTFDKTLNEYSERAMERNESLSLLMIDIDFFKKVNDTYGHGSGDMVLKQLGEILLRACRSFDVVSRKGGEEFAVILPNCNYQNAVTIAERIRKSVEDALFIIENDKKIVITVSVGVGSYPDKTNDPATLLHDSDDALYCAKKTGRNKVV